MNVSLPVVCPGCPLTASDVHAGGGTIATSTRGPRRVGVLLVAEAEPVERDGVASPLPGHAERQRAALAGNLGRRKLDVLAALAWHAGEEAGGAASIAHRTIREAVAELVAAGATEILAVSLAPQFSDATVCRICRELAARPSSPGSDPQAEAPTIDIIRDWHAEPRLLAALASATYEALDAIWAAGSSDRPGVDWALGNKTDAPVIFVTPDRRGLPDGDPYRELVRETSTLVAERLGLPTWAVAFVECGRAGAPESTDLDGGLEAVARGLAQKGFDRAAVCPVGWTADGLDILDDLDGRAAAIARTVGIELERARSMNDDPVFIAALADIVQRYVERGTTRVATETATGR